MRGSRPWSGACLLLSMMIEGVVKGVVKKAIVYAISWVAVISIIERHACECTTRRIFFF